MVLEMRLTVTTKEGEGVVTRREHRGASSKGMAIFSLLIQE